MHPEVSQFIDSVKWKHPDYFVNKKVLEVGSLDINGSIRSHFKNCEYVGLDLGEGKGVDVVCPIHEYNYNYYGPNEGKSYLTTPQGHFDVVISTEMLEHDKYWVKSLKSMYTNTRIGGLFILTCAGPNRQEHGTTRTTPGDAPFTNDYYRNISVEDFNSVLPKELFVESSIGLYRGDTDLYFYGITKYVVA